MWFQCILAWITVALLTNLCWLWLPSCISDYASSEHCTCVRCTPVQTIPIRKLPVLHHDSHSVYLGPPSFWYLGRDELEIGLLAFATRRSFKHEERVILGPFVATIWKYDDDGMLGVRQWCHSWPKQMGGHTGQQRKWQYSVCWPWNWKFKWMNLCWFAGLYSTDGNQYTVG